MSSEVKITNVDSKVKSKFIEWHDKTSVIFSKGNKLFISDRNFKKQNLIGQFPTNIFLKLLSNFSICKRFLRYYYYNVFPLDEKRVFVTFRKSLGVFQNNQFCSINGLVRPARFLRNACAKDENGGVYLGEYIPNLSRDQIHIYYLPPNSLQLKIVHTFGKNVIRHIHGIYKDPYSNEFWILTGDVKNECKILKTSDQFKTITEVGSGSENWRAVSIQFTKADVYFGTDAEFNKNYIFKMNRKSLKTKIVSEIDGPVYYSSKIRDQIIFAVTAEGCPSQKQNRAAIWKVNKDNTATLIKTYDKDIFPIQLMPGTIHFSNGIIDDHIYGYGIGLKGLNHESIKIQC